MADDRHLENRYNDIFPLWNCTYCTIEATDRNEASRSLFATAELLVLFVLLQAIAVGSAHVVALE